MTEFFSKWKWLLLAFAGIVVLVCIVLLGGAGWTVFSQRAVPEPAGEPVSFGYCGAELTELCVVSFGQDVFGDTIINLYVPFRRYSVFYLNIVRRSGESQYECTWSKDFKTSVYCVGDAINLGEGFEIQMLSKKNNSLLAQGAFTLTAYFVTTPVIEGNDLMATSTPSGIHKNVTSTPESTVTSTPTPLLSYPSYP